LFLGANERGIIDLKKVENFKALTAKGISGSIAGTSLFVGSPKALQERGVMTTQAENVLREMAADAATVLGLEIDSKLVALIAVKDTVKQGTISVLQELKKKGINVIMATGDNAEVAKSVARQLGIEKFRSECMPADKLNLIKELRTQGHVVGMAGDGINDGPALAGADIGIAMGNGTGVAIESANITLVKGDLRGILRARNLSSATVSNIKQNLIFAFGYNALGIPVAAGLLYPFMGQLLNPMIAALAMSLSSVSVIANSLRLNKTRVDI
jgi:Cu+-exporting ATPase